MWHWPHTVGDLPVSGMGATVEARGAAFDLVMSSDTAAITATSCEDQPPPLAYSAEHGHTTGQMKLLHVFVRFHSIPVA